MKISPQAFLTFSLTIFTTATGICTWKIFSANSTGVMSCSTKVIMHFENMTTENVNGTIHFNFGTGGKGSLIVEGYTNSAAGWLYLQRYVKFNYTTKRISSGARHYRISKWEASASSIDQSPHIIFDYFMREMSDSHEGLFLTAQKLNDNVILLNSLSSPLYICTLKPGSKFD